MELQSLEPTFSEPVVVRAAATQTDYDWETCPECLTMFAAKRPKGE